MKIRRNRKGFTIVELIIVIAVIAILAAILIPTFIHLANKAGDASDQTIVKNANTQLAMRAAEGRKNTSMSEAVKDVDQIGYHIPAVSTSNGNQICWDRENDRFALFNKDNDLIFGDGDVAFDKNNPSDFNRFFKAVSSLDAEETHGFLPYAKEGFTGNEHVTISEGTVTLDTVSSFDTGDLPSITTVNVTSASATGTTYVGTNSTSVVVNVNVPNGTVYHLGVAKDVMVNGIASASMHEAGRVGFEKMNCAGRIVAEKTAEVKALWFSVADAKYDKIAGASVKEYADSPAIANSLTLSGINASEIVTDATESTVQAGAETAIANEIAKESGEESSNQSKPITTEKDLEDALANGGEYYLANDITVTTSKPGSTVEVAIDLHGNKINLNDISSLNEFDCLIATKNRLTFDDTVGGGSVIYASSTTHADALFGVFNSGVIVINGGNFLSASDNIFGGVTPKEEPCFYINGGSIHGYFAELVGIIQMSHETMIECHSGMMPWYIMGNVVAGEGYSVSRTGSDVVKYTCVKL